MVPFLLFTLFFRQKSPDRAYFGGGVDHQHPLAAVRTRAVRTDTPLRPVTVIFLSGLLKSNSAFFFSSPFFPFHFATPVKDSSCCFLVARSE